MHAVILAGGEGSRLWPASTNNKPKPFLQLPNNKSLLQDTLTRACNLPRVKNIITITHSSCAITVEQQYRQLADTPLIQNQNLEIITEPFSKNTAAAITASVLHIRKQYGPDATVLILPSDHIISNMRAFSKAINKAMDIIDDGKIITLGIQPSYAETDYGYIESDHYSVVRFIEKPGKILAKKYLKNRNYLWNSGILCFKAKDFILAMNQHCKDILYNVQRAFNSALIDDSFNHNQILLNQNYWHLLPNISIDYALMEKLEQVAVIPCDIGWQDVGNWNRFSKLLSQNIDGNNLIGNVITHGTSDCYIESNGIPIAAIGVKNLVIVETKNGLLVVDKDNTSDIKHIFSLLKSQNNLAKNTN
ncbi:MAG: mannose-1-phosphate guanylyltransferase [Rickettsiaceae bacterium]